jgi:hypothetical protein
MVRITKMVGGGVPFTETVATASDGTYTSGELPMGTGANFFSNYSVRVVSPTPDLFVTGDPPNSVNTGATWTVVVTLSDPVESTIDFVKLVGQISGKVVDASGNPQAGVMVRITKMVGGGVPFTETVATASDGTYTSGELPMGSGTDNDAQYDVKVISPSPRSFAPGDPGHLLGTPPGMLDTTLSLSVPDQTDVDFTKVG